MKPIDLSKFVEQYKDKWIALTLDMQKVIASGDSIDEVEKEVETKGLDLGELIITKLPDPDTCYCPHFTCSK